MTALAGDRTVDTSGQVINLNTNTAFKCVLHILGYLQFLQTVAELCADAHYYFAHSLNSPWGSRASRMCPVRRVLTPWATRAGHSTSTIHERGQNDPSISSSGERRTNFCFIFFLGNDKIWWAEFSSLLLLVAICFAAIQQHCVLGLTTKLTNFSCQLPMGVAIMLLLYVRTTEQSIRPYYARTNMAGFVGLLKSSYSPLLAAAILVVLLELITL